MDHLTRIQNEFTKQADTFDAYAPKADLRVEERFCGALGSDAGLVLDLACGPGVVTAAVAQVASSVMGFDATAAMLDKARQRCSEQGIDNVSFEQGDAASLPFADKHFDTVVTRLSVHHFEDPTTVLAEVFRVLRPGGLLVIADVVVSEDPAEAALQNAIENLRDPSHVRMLASTELNALLENAGFHIRDQSTWDKEREFNEWMSIVNDSHRTQSLRIVARTLAASGHTAGMGLSIKGNQLSFFHRWIFITAVR